MHGTRFVTILIVFLSLPTSMSSMNLDLYLLTCFNPGSFCLAFLFSSNEFTLCFKSRMVRMKDFQTVIRIEISILILFDITIST